MYLAIQLLTRWNGWTLVPVEIPWNLLWIHLECWAAKLRCYGPSIWSNLIRNCTAMAQLSKVESANQWAFIQPSLELISRCSLSTPGLSVRTRFSRYKGCRAVGTKINKILNCYLPFVAAGATGPTFKFFIRLDLEKSGGGGFREEWTSVFLAESDIEELWVLSSAMHFTAIKGWIYRQTFKQKFA